MQIWKHDINDRGGSNHYTLIPKLEAAVEEV